jgi:TPP-dependent pyruvate/acetoin dehydrogenase alpha subunit
VAEKVFKPLISNTKLWQIYEAMLRARLFEERFAAQSRMPHRLRREEAMLAALLDGLGKRDVLIARKENLGAALLRGQSVSSVLGQAFSDDRSATRPIFAPATDSNVFTGSVAEMATFAAGVSMGLQISKAANAPRSVTLALLGEVKDGLKLDAALRVAAQSSLPLILVCRTNNAHKLKLNSEELHDVPHMPVDGQDAVAMCRVAQEALGRTRAGIGSVLVECRFFSDQPDPIEAMKDRLQAKEIFSQRRYDLFIERFAATLEDGFHTLVSKR